MHDLSFIVKKFITFLLEPYGLFLILLTIGIFFLQAQKVKVARNIFYSLLFLMLFLAYPPFSNFLIKGLEDNYVKYDYSQNLKYIHVLGNGHITDSSQPISSLISNAGVKRVLEGVIIYKHTSNTRLIFTGYKHNTNTSNAQMNSNLAMSLGVDKEDIILNHKCKDTKDEAIFAKSIIGSEPFILVSSATHMKRAISIFKSIGLNPIPAPTDFHKNEINSYSQPPSISALKESQIAIHEYLGILWNKIYTKGKT